MKPVMQTMFGGCDAPREQLGNCYPACVASVLDIALEDVPHFYQLHYRDNEAALDEALRFFRARDLVVVTFEWGSWARRYFHGTVVIFGGKSPRGEYDHAIVGRITRDGWELLHYPHPSSDGIVGEPRNFDMIFPLMLIEQSQMKVAA